MSDVVEFRFKNMFRKSDLFEREWMMCSKKLLNKYLTSFETSNFSDSLVI